MATLQNTPRESQLLLANWTWLRIVSSLLAILSALQMVDTCLFYEHFSKQGYCTSYHVLIFSAIYCIKDFSWLDTMTDQDIAHHYEYHLGLFGWF